MSVRRAAPLLVAALVAAASTRVLAAPPLGHGPEMPTYDVIGKDIATLERDMAAGRIDAAGLVRLYLARIARIDRGPDGLHAVLALNPDAYAEAEASDARIRQGAARRPLEGIPILVKDNIETADPTATTAGSLALAANVGHRDAPLVARLRAAGAVILGKTNLSEWADIRSSFAVSGWSGVGGLTHNPYARDRTACGSSSGSGVAVAASLAAAAIGTETDGSVTCPASTDGVVGLKPTVGLISRRFVVPISASQDTAGPLAHDVADAALLARVMAGVDPADPATQDAGAHLPALPRTGAAAGPGALRGLRIGVARFLAGKNEATDRVFAAALDQLRRQGAVLVEIPQGPDLDAISNAELTVLIDELRTGLDAYLATAAPAVATRSLAGVIAFDDAHAAREEALFGQDLFLKAEASGGISDPGYAAARATSLRMAGADGVLKLLAANRVSLLVAPTGGPAALIDVVDGDHDVGGASTLPAVAGLPHLSVPMGLADGLPVGLSFIGPAWSESLLFAAGRAYESARPAVPAPTFPATLPLDATMRAALSPS